MPPAAVGRISLRIRTFMLAALSVLALSAGHGRAEDRLRIGTAAQAFAFVPIDLGISAGIYQRLGLAVEKIDFSGAAKLNQGMLAHAADLGATGSTDIAFSVKGAPTRTVSGIVNLPVNMAVSVRNDIQSVDQLKGKRLGVTQSGTLTYWLAHELARVKGWGPEGITTVPVGGALANQLAALVTNQVDAVVVDAAVGLMLAEQKRGRVLLTAQDYTPDLMSNSIIAHQDLIRDHPEAVRRFLKGGDETVTYLLAHKNEAVQAGMAATGLPESVMSAEYDQQREMWSRDGRISPEQLETLARAITEIGLVDEKPDLSKYYDPRFLP